MDHHQIAEALPLVEEASRGRAGPYALQAATAAQQRQRASFPRAVSARSSVARRVVRAPKSAEYTPLPN